PLDVRIGSRGASGPVSGPRRDTDRRTKMIYAINYDLKRPGQNYDELHKAIKNLGDWWHYLGSTWLVDTNLNAKGVWDRLPPPRRQERPRPRDRRHPRLFGLADPRGLGMDQQPPQQAGGLREG